MNVMIGVDPLKASTPRSPSGGTRTRSQVSRSERRASGRTALVLGRCVREAHLGHRVSGRNGVPLAQQLVARGEDVLDVPATLASRIRVLATGRSDKNDPNDAHSIAIAALRAPVLRQVEPADHGEVLRLLSKRNWDLGRQRARVVCRLHSLFSEVAPGGIAKEVYVSDAETLLAKVTPESPAQQLRVDVILELLDEVRRLDLQTKESHRRIRLAVKASGTSVTEVWSGTHPRRVADRVLRRHPSLRQPGRLRLLQRHGSHRVLMAITR